jgi:transcriptional regulator with XRE-family HTH domain
MGAFGTRLKHLREERDLGVAELAKKIGIPASTYREWEYGRAIKGEPYVGIANALNISLQELMTGEKPNKNQLLKKFEHLESQFSGFKNDLLSFL